LIDFLRYAKILTNRVSSDGRKHKRTRTLLRQIWNDQL